MVHSTAESDMTETTQHACMDLLGLFIYLTIKVIKDQGQDVQDTLPGNGLEAFVLSQIKSWPY